jgi:6-phosphogluconolactonase
MKDKTYLESAHIDLRILSEKSQLGEDVARFFISCARECIHARGRFVVALSGGQTPVYFLKTLARKYQRDCDWNQVHFFWGDERSVPPEDEGSNYHTARIHLFDKISIPPDNIHRVLSEFPVEEAAGLYRGELRGFFGLQEGELPRFDLIFLGVGEDGHTASLFPETAVLKNSHDLVGTTESANGRITFTYSVINAARNVAVVVSGSEKSNIVERALTTSASPGKMPVQGIRLNDGKLIWFLDQAAAMDLRRKYD